MRDHKQISKLRVTVELEPLCNMFINEHIKRSRLCTHKISIEFALEMFTELIIKKLTVCLGLIIFDSEMKTNMYKTIRHHILEYRILLINLLKKILKE
jgi:hypothetical protein